MTKTRAAITVLLASALTLGLPGAAGAAGEEVPAWEPAGTSSAVEDIDADLTGSVELVALANDDAYRVAVPGLVMDLHLVEGVDVTTADGMDEAHELTEKAPGVADLDGLDLSLVTTLDPTDATGRSWVEDLPVGLYVISQAAQDGSDVTYPPMAFTMPSMSPVADIGWVYDLRVYPKPSGEAPAPAPAPVEPTEDPAQQTEAPAKAAPAAPKPGVPTGELIAANRDPALLLLALALILGAATAVWGARASTRGR